jgi:ribonuclease HI
VDGLKHVEIYTDGACRGNGKSSNLGGYGIVLMCEGHVKEVKKGCKNTTNNIMELQSVVDALTILKEPCRVTLHSDSAYVVNAFSQNWLSSWIKNGWKTATGKPVKNQELWETLSKLIQVHTVKFVKVKGHANNQWNNRCDELANMAMDEI